MQLVEAVAKEKEATELEFESRPDSDAARAIAQLRKEKGKLGLAQAAADAALSEFPNSPHVLCEAGTVFRDANDFPRAIALFENAQKHDPLNTYPLNCIGSIYRKLKRFGDAEDAIQKSLALAPEDKVALTELGLIAQAKGEPDRARAIYERIVELYPQDRYAHLCLGSLAKEGRDFDRAISHFQTALTISAGDEKAHISLAECQHACGNYPEATKSYERSIALNPENSFSQLGIAKPLLKLGRFEEAREHLLVALDCNIGNSTRTIICNFLARTSLKEGKFPEAIAKYEAVLTQEPHNSYTLTGLAYCYMNTGQKELASTCLAKAMDGCTTRLARSDLEKRTARYNVAMDHAQAAQKADPKSDAVNLRIAKLNLLMGESPELARNALAPCFARKHPDYEAQALSICTELMEVTDQGVLAVLAKDLLTLERNRRRPSLISFSCLHILAEHGLETENFRAIVGLLQTYNYFQPGTMQVNKVKAYSSQKNGRALNGLLRAAVVEGLRNEILS